ncbi:bifunctional diaminohydroxyphosphoribosylaminopyrimidine deaminase/5-amino-6-(5-phosphoribosylamino)uracil reductase RibD [Leifsonia sp. 71-9]|mgnify:CR=1 FL=1|uniref:bifunctional diaminohydroxyphosphoribosylaminopyrimidine deaminase/5-amino-6-(5-phosphoribosylamino)uracil reductase RibD n=1 Tax=Leifsonia sp. 71-9 TaxID=1895934 RepID=UPI00092A6348|nr:bifunctional diaminohydroxyphosphoribosylaminopyrimidine deaminase/5-amino-6-(5-phosphoribosylamino)uracil reductase RibD [Leifsonia sp. 71-9]OJX74527.1 MAG: riboflavin biosynthesis protein RibD [Leifsonia sp. 71-9]
MTREAAMRTALELAANGPATGVNPRVGCVILAPDGSVIAEGWHRGAGTPHAEVDALSKLPEGGARGATAVVTLEPCNHWGLTGPCSEALIAAGVAEVIYGVDDPGRNSGGGAERLREAGVVVTGGVLAGEIEEFLGDWLTAARLGRPHITVKWASSLDGRAAAVDGTSKWITGTAARQRVHEQREASDAIVVGTGTVLADDPSLTARGDAGELLAAQPTPVVVGTRAVPNDAAVFRHPRPVVFEGTHDLHAVVADLHQRGFRRVYVEGGPTLASAFVAAGLVDEYAIYLAPTLLGGPRLALGEIGVDTIGEQRRLRILGVEHLGGDLYIRAVPLAPASPSTDSAQEG